MDAHTHTNTHSVNAALLNIHFSELIQDRGYGALRFHQTCSSEEKPLEQTVHFVTNTPRTKLMFPLQGKRKHVGLSIGYTLCGGGGGGGFFLAC